MYCTVLTYRYMYYYRYITGSIKSSDLIYVINGEGRSSSDIGNW